MKKGKKTLHYQKLPKILWSQTNKASKQADIEWKCDVVRRLDIYTIKSQWYMIIYQHTHTYINACACVYIYVYIYINEARSSILTTENIYIEMIERTKVSSLCVTKQNRHKVNWWVPPVLTRPKVFWVKQRYVDLITNV